MIEKHICLKGTHEQEVAALDALTPEQRAQNNANALSFLFGDWKEKHCQ